MTPFSVEAPSPANRPSKMKYPSRGVRRPSCGVLRPPRASCGRPAASCGRPAVSGGRPAVSCGRPGRPGAVRRRPAAVLRCPADRPPTASLQAVPTEPHPHCLAKARPAGRLIIGLSTGYAPSSPLGRPYPVGITSGLTFDLPITTLLSRGQRPAGRRPQLLPVLLLDGNHGRWPLCISSSSVSSMTSNDPHLDLEGMKPEIFTCFIMYMVAETYFFAFY